LQPSKTIFERSPHAEAEHQKANFNFKNMSDQTDRIYGTVIERGSQPQRGFVFIGEPGSTTGIFAHATSFPHEWRGAAFSYVIGRAVSFEVETSLDGRLRAARVEVFADEQEGA
jgi:hypothetical protein